MRRLLVSTLGAAFILLSLGGLALLALRPSEDTAETPPAASRPVAEPALGPTPGPTGEAVPAVAWPQLVLDEHFTDNRMSWPDNRASTAWFGEADYRLAAREARRFVAVEAPINTPVGDAVLTATFQKQSHACSNGLRVAGTATWNTCPPTARGARARRNWCRVPCAS